MLISHFIIHKSTQFTCTLRKCKKVSLLIIKTKTCNEFNACKRKFHAIPQSPLSVLFFGTDEFAVESLKILHNNESKVLQRLEVVTANKGKENAVSKYAKENRIVINKWPLNINVTKFDIGIVVSFGYLIPSNIIHSFPLGMLNIHGSLLPRWRGAAPIVYSLMNGDLQTGVTIMKIMPKKFDIGKIVLQKEITINEHETLPELYTKLAKLGANLLEKVFEDLPQLLQSAKPQNEANVTYAPKITSKIALIKWNEMSAKNIYDLQRAILGLYPLTTKFQNVTVKLHDIKKIEEPITETFEGEMPGVVIYDKRTDALIIKCKGESYISVKKVTVQGRPRMNARDFYNGFMAGKAKTKVTFS